MKKLKIILSFIYCRAGDLVKITRRIIDSLKNNAQFPNPTPALTDVENKLEEYLVSLSDAGGRDREKVAIKDNKQAELRQLLTDLAHYITQTCKGDKAMLLSSGFDITPERSNQQKVPPKLQAEMAMPGQVTTRIKRITKARAYVHQITADPLTPQSVWASETSLQPEHTFTGLTSASKVWLRIIVIDRYGKQIVWEPVARIVQ
jgi:hypothetical protein